jgi:hypothetical protein
MVITSVKGNPFAFQPGWGDPYCFQPGRVGWADRGADSPLTDVMRLRPGRTGGKPHEPPLWRADALFGHG